MTVQKKILDLTGSQYLVQKVKSAINDVDSSLSTHIADTDIHVTTADKNKWNNQTFVFRYSSTALVASSTNSNTLLDNTDNLKVGDKVIDSNGVLFSITAIDTANSTFTIGTALIDLAKDSDVVHTSGNETISGVKTFSSTIRLTGYPNIRMYVPDDEWNVQPVDAKQSEIRFTDKNNGIISYFAFQHRTDVNEPFRTCWRQNRLDGTINYYSVNFNNLGEFYPENNNAIKLGTSLKLWSEVHAKNYYYGSDNIEFSTKFVTTDTAQTVSGAKTFSSDLAVANTDTTANTPNLNLKNYKADRGTTETAVQTIMFSDKNAKALTSIESRRVSNGNTATNILCYNTDDNNNTVSGGVAIIKSKTDTNFAPNADNAVTCGRALAKWSDVQTYKVNGLEPSALSMPDLANGIDISSYIPALDSGNTQGSYTPSVNGFIVFRGVASTGGCSIVQGNMGNNASYVTDPQTSNKIVNNFLPVIKDNPVVITVKGLTSIEFIYFYPCQGNI